MLILAPDVKGERSGAGATGKAANKIRTLFVRSALVIDYRLAEMKAVIQRLTLNAGRADVHGLNHRFEIGAPVPRRSFKAELGSQSVTDPPGFQIAVLSFGLDALTRLLQEARAFHARPRLQTGECGRQVSQATQPVKGRVHPAVH